MIITNLEHLIVDDYPTAIECVLQFICANKTKLIQAQVGEYVHEDLIFNIEESHSQITWHSHLNKAVIHFIIEGEEFLEFSNIKDLEITSQKQDVIFYQGSKKGRIKLSQHDLIILYPEFAYLTQPSYHSILFKKGLFFVPLS